MPMPVAQRFKAKVCSPSLDGTAGSNPAGSVDICLSQVFCVVRYRSLRRTNPSYREVLPSVVCDLETSSMRRPWPAWPKAGLGLQREIERGKDNKSYRSLMFIDTKL